MKTLKCTCIGLLAMFMVVGCGASADQETPTGQWQVDENNRTATLGCTPEAEAVWTTTNIEPWYAPGRIQFSQNDGLISMPSRWIGINRVQRTHDGATFEQPGIGSNAALDKSWDLTTVGPLRNEPLRIERRSTGESLLDVIPEREDAEIVTAEIAASGRSAMALTCAAGEHRLLRWTLPDGQMTHTVPLDTGSERCNTWQGPRSLVQIGPAEDFVFVALRQTGEMFHVDLNTGELTTARVEPADMGETVTDFANGVILDAHIDPSGRRVLLSTDSGRAEVRRIPDLSRTMRFDIGVSKLNEMTYAPHILSSPVAWAPDGRRFASVGENKQVVVRNLDGEILQSFDGAVADTDEMWGMEDVPVALGFSHDGTRLAVGHYFGAAMYACEGASFPRSDETFDEDVSLEGPTRVEAFESHEWTVSVDGHPGAVERVLIDGEPVRMRGRGLFNWRPHEPGVYELTAEVDDGRATGRTSVTVTVE